MKRILFHNPVLSLNILIICIAFTACQKQTSTSSSEMTEEIATAKAGSKPGTVAEMPLRVTINNTGNNITGDGVQAPDGSYDYINAQQNVTAKFDQYGNFIFQCGLGGRGNNTYMIRWFNVNFSEPILVNTTPPLNSTEKGLAMTTIRIAAFPDALGFQNMIDNTPVCIGLTAGTTSWVANFHRGLEDFGESQAAYAVVTRSSDTWTITPVGTCSPNSNVAALRISGELYGYYNMPFSLTLTKL